MQRWEPLYGLCEVPRGWPSGRKGPGLQGRFCHGLRVRCAVSACTMRSAYEESFLVSLVDRLRKWLTCIEL